jgi:photosystem II stability/assembly factor-like uncharacterized protein
MVVAVPAYRSWHGRWSTLFAVVSRVSFSLVAGALACATPSPQTRAPESEQRGKWVPVVVETSANLRGLSAASDTVVWASGSEGTILRSVDAGQNWSVLRVSGAEDRDFRDIEAFDASRAVAMAVGSPALFVFTDDGGETWARAYRDDHPEVFFDAMDFWDESRGIAMSDPIGGRFVFALTEDGGRSWNPLPEANRPPALEGEAGFAGSGTCLRVGPDGHAWLGTGGTHARVWMSEDYGKSWTVADTPFAAGEGTGVFSVAVSPSGLGLAVGGDYRDETLARDNLALTEDGGRSWKSPPVGSSLGGFREVVSLRPGRDGREWWALGPSGFDRSTDGGRSWISVDLEARYHALVFGPRGARAWAVGADGAVARWVGP